MAVLEIIASATDRASGVLQGVSDQGQRAAKSLSVNWKKVSVAGAAAGVALEGLARKVAPLNQGIRNLADSTDLHEDAIRELTASMVDHTFSAEDAIALMEKGRQQGLRSAEELERYARFWDLVSDATGEAAQALADGGVALRALGIDAGNEAEAINALGFVLQETSTDVGEFLGLVERMAPEMRELGMSVDDAAAMFGILEERGISGRAAMREFRQATTAADGDMNALRDALGITTEEWDKMRAAVDQSGEVLERRAQTNYEAGTSLQRLQAWVSRLTVEHGELLESLGDLTPVLFAIGPAIKIAELAYSGMGKAAKFAGAKIALVNIGLLATIGTLALVVAAVAAIGATIYLLINEIEIMGEVISDHFNMLWDGWAEIIEPLVGKIDQAWRGLADRTAQTWSQMVGAIRQSANGIIGIVNRVVAAIELMINAAAAAATTVPGITVSGISLPRIPTMHTGGVFRAPRPGGEGFALLRDGETVTPASQRAVREPGRSVALNFENLFAGANIRMTTPGDAERLSEQLYGLMRSRLRAEGATT